MSIIRNILNSTVKLVNNEVPTTGSNIFYGNQQIVGEISASSISGIGNTNEFSTSVVSRLNQLSTISGSNITRLNNLESKSESVDISIININSYTSSNDTKWSNLTSQSSSFVLESETGSFARLDATNIFTQTQTITGSMYISGDLIVQGSSSLENITASAVSIGTNVVYLNTDTPAVRFAGLSVFDSGSTDGTGSLFWDSQNERWIYQKSSGSSYSGGMLISGPRNTGSLGEEVGMPTNKLIMGIGGDHISSSNIYHDGTNTAFAGNVEVTGSITGQILATNGIVSGSSQIDVMSTTNIARLATTGSNTFTGNITINTGTTGFITLGASNSYGSISSGGNGATIYLNGATRGGTTTAASNTIVVATDGEFYITNGAANSTKFLVASNGNTTISGIFTENSSIRYKENVETIKYGLDKVLQMRGVTYDKKDNGVKEMGVIAEEVYDVLPEVVLKNEEGEIDSVSYSRITAVLIEAIKDLKKEIEDLKSNR